MSAQTPLLPASSRKCHYLVNNGDAHVKNFSLTRLDDTGEHRLAPAYDLLNTRLHVPTETRTALQLFKGDYETESHKANAYYAYDDFVEFAKRLELVERRYKRILQDFIDKQGKVDSMIDRSALPEECKQLYKGHVEDRVKALKHSYVALGFGGQK